MQRMWLYLYSGKQFEEAFENTQWRKIKQMQSVWFCNPSGRKSEGSFENTQWRKAKQMQPVWLCILWCRQFEETFENTQCRKVTNATMPLHHRQAIWKIIWKYTIWGDAWKQKTKINGTWHPPEKLLESFFVAVFLISRTSEYRSTNRNSFVVVDMSDIARYMHPHPHGHT